MTTVDRGPAPTDVASNITLEILARHVDEGRGDVPALRFLRATASPEHGETVTYAELAHDADRFARAVVALGVAPGETVVVLAGRTPALYVTVLGALRAGAVVCPLFAAFGPEPIRQRMQLGHAVALVTTTTLYRRKIAPMRNELDLRHVILLDGDGTEADTLAFADLIDAAPDTAELPTTRASSPALLHFTSGTTGRPKGAVHVHGALAMHRATTADVLGVREGDVFWCTADPGWVTGTTYGIIGPLACGATVVVDEAEFDADRWYTILDRQRVQVWYTAPTAVRMLMRAGPDAAQQHARDALRSAFSVGEPLAADAVRWSEQHLGVPLRDTWWQTETGAIMIATGWDQPTVPGSIGRSVPGVEAGLLATDADGDVVVDETGNVRPITDPDAIGMIALRPGWPSMFIGYLDDEARTQAAFTDGWYLSGDLARRDDEGRFWFVGRADDVIKTAGHLIGPFEVEQALNEHPAVAASGAYGVPDAIAGAVVHARVVLHRGVEPTDDTLTSILAHARRRLGPTLAPREIRAVDALPTTRSGKVMRRLLRARELGLPEGDTSTLEQPGARP